MRCTSHLAAVEQPPTIDVELGERGRLRSGALLVEASAQRGGRGAGQRREGPLRGGSEHFQSTKATARQASLAGFAERVLGSWGFGALIGRSHTMSVIYDMHDPGVEM